MGLATSTMQEGVHWSLKSQLRGRSVMAHMLQNFLLRVLLNRKIGVERRRSSIKPLRNLKIALTKKGGRGRLVFESLGPCVTEYGQIRLLTQYALSDGNEFHEVPWAEVVEHGERVREDMLAQDGASWLRFCYLLEETQLGQDCRVFVVQLEEENADNSRRPYWLLVLPSGSVSRSCREVAEWGGFDRHAFDLVRQRVIVFASLAHFHPTYLVPAAKDLADKSRFAVIPDEMSADAASSATWDEAFELSKEKWDREGL